MGNRVAIAGKVFWNWGLDVTTGGIKYRASMFIKTALEAAFGFPSVLQITKAALNNVDNSFYLFRLITILFDPTLSYIDRSRFLQWFFKP